MSANAKNGNGNKTFEWFNGLLSNELKPDNCTFLCLLSAGGKLDSLEKGKLMYRWIVGDGIELDVVIANTVINMYSKCQSLEDAYNVFVQLPFPNVVSWAALITGHAQSGHTFGVLELYRKMKFCGMQPNVVVYSCVLKACSGIRGLCIGREIHDAVTKVGISVDVIVGTAIFDMYAKLGSIEEANNCFDRHFDLDVVSLGAIMSSHVQNENGDLDLEMLSKMLQQGADTSEALFVIADQAYIINVDLTIGNLLHEFVVKAGFQVDSLVDMYSRCGSGEDALPF